MTTAILDFITSNIVTLDLKARCAIVDIVDNNEKAIDIAIEITGLEIFSVLATDEISVQIREFIENYKKEETTKIKAKQNLKINSIRSLGKDYAWFTAHTNKGDETVYHVDYKITEKHKGLPRMKVSKIDSSGQIDKCEIYCTQNQYRSFCKELKITAF